MKRLLFMLCLLSMISALRAEVVETPVTIQMKLHSQLPNVTNGQTTLYNYQVVSFKNSDLIHHINIQKNRSFTKKARIIHRYEFTAQNSKSMFIIRDPGVPDYDASAHFQSLLKTDIKGGNTLSSVGKGKFTGEIGQSKIPSDGIFTFKPGDDVALEISGYTVQGLRAIPSKQHPGKRLLFTSVLVNGTGSFDLTLPQSTPHEGLAKGTYKCSGGRVLPFP